MPEYFTVFVYGTLKKGFHNHVYMAGANYLGTGTTVEKYAMLVDRGLPFLIKKQRISHIFGELYSVDKILLNNLDRLEGHPNWYRREEVKIASSENGITKAWMYFCPTGTGKLNSTGLFTG